ncbi:MAG: aconitate hydratase AcnA [Alphaproteobacteria bacterium]|jgi:aconitate hydratase
MQFTNIDSFKAKKTLSINGKQYHYFDLNIVASKLGFDLDKMPKSLKILFENVIRFEDGKAVKVLDIAAFAEWMKSKKSDHEIAYHPARVLMQDFTGVPAVVDLAAMRDAMKKLGLDPKKINPLIPVHLVIDHSVQVDKYATEQAFSQNVELEMERNRERYEFLKWGQTAFSNFKVVPPGTGICHQVNLEMISRVVWSDDQDGNTYVYPDTLVGTDSHTTMVNGLAVLGWGVGGIEAEAAMLGQPISMVIPEVIGFELKGKLREGTTATDLVLTITQMLRNKGVVNKFVEFYGEGLSSLAVADRATISNMAPEYGATCGYFPVDEETMKYLKLSARDNELIMLVEQYSKAQGLWRSGDESEIRFTDSLSLDMFKVEPSLSGPKRPQDKVLLSSMPENFKASLPLLNKNPGNVGKAFDVANSNYKLQNGDVVIAAITSCTNTSNPSVMIGAGLIARKARQLGMNVKPWVKTSLAPGSKVVTEYLEHSGLQKDLDGLGFNLVGYGCTTCIGNSGPLLEEIENTVASNNLVVASVLSGNRNFEGRIHPLVRANYLASPMLCVIYSLVGNVNADVMNSPLGQDAQGRDVYLKDLWPSNAEIAQFVKESLNDNMFRKRYADVFEGDEDWKNFAVSQGVNYSWNDKSTYIKRPPYFDDMSYEAQGIKDIVNANILAILGDSITTDHISPAGSISKDGPAAKYLNNLGVERKDFNSYGARRGNHEAMMRGTFANVRIKNEMLQDVEGGQTRYKGKGDNISIYDAAMLYKSENTPSIIIAGKDYGSGSSRDWAAKGPNLLGVRAVIAESFERIHRSNLVGMGVLPLVFKNGMTRADLKLIGDEVFNLKGLANLTPHQCIQCEMIRSNGEKVMVELECRVDTEVEMEYMNNGGILQYVLRNLH